MVGKKSIWVVAVIAMLTYSCATNVNTTDHQNQENPQAKDETTSHFQLLDASKQSWVAGIQSGGSGVEYYFELQIKTAKQLVFDSLWVDGGKYAMYLANTSGSISNKPVSIQKGDKAMVRASVLNKHKNQNTAASPIPYEGEVLIRYNVDGDHHYLVLDQINTRPRINRP